MLMPHTEHPDKHGLFEEDGKVYAVIAVNRELLFRVLCQLLRASVSNVREGVR